MLCLQCRSIWCKCSWQTRIWCEYQISRHLQNYRLCLLRNNRIAEDISLRKGASKQILVLTKLKHVSLPLHCSSIIIFFFFWVEWNFSSFIVELLVFSSISCIIRFIYSHYLYEQDCLFKNYDVFRYRIPVWFLLE